jgi:exopolysaccharide biosynthesis protein
MFKAAHRGYFLLALLALITVSLDGQTRGFEKSRHKGKRIAAGLEWRHTLTAPKDTLPQNINILLVDQQRRKLLLLYSPFHNALTSTMADSTKALAAVNAGFFSIKEGGSLTYIKIAGRIVDSDTAPKWPRVENVNGAITVDRDGRLSIMRAMRNSWFDSCLSCHNVLITGPLLLFKGERVAIPGNNLTVNRHPRTAVGILRDGRVVLLTADGRADEAAGLTIAGLTDLMISLGCTDAVNLDGGGSTAMWIRGKPFRGIVSMPSDNKKFDHEGERAVADILIVK